MIKRLIMASALILTAQAYAQIDVFLNNKPAQENSVFYIFFDDLISGKISFSLSGQDGIIKAEISLDSGRSWQEMAKDANRFVYEYRPISKEEELTPVFLINYLNGSSQTNNPFIKVIYQKDKPQAAIALLLEKMKSYYEQARSDRIMSLFSSRYSDRIKFEESIQRDFYNYKNIRLFHRIDSIVFDADYKGAICDVYWERKFDTRTGSASSDSAKVQMQLQKEGLNWMITGMRNNTIFGSSLLASADLTVSSGDISKTHVSPDDVINAVIYNNGNASAENFKVRFYSAGNFDGTVDVSSLAANSQTTVSYTVASGGGFTVTVTVDSTGVVTESNEANNEATKSFPSDPT